MSHEKKGGHDDHKKDDAKKAGIDAESSPDSMKAGLASFLQGDFLKKATRSGAQPTLRRKAEMVAEYLKRFFPKDHVLRSDVSEAVIDFVGESVRALAEGKKTWGGVAVTEIGEFIKMVGEEFCKENGGDGNHTGSKNRELASDQDSERAKKFDAGDATLAEDGLKHILNAPPTAIDDIREINRGRANAWHEHKETIRHGPLKHEEEPEPGVPFSERLHQVGEAVEKALTPLNDDLEKGVARLQAHNQKLRDEKLATASPSKSPGAKFVRWLFK